MQDLIIDAEILSLTTPLASTHDLLQRAFHEPLIMFFMVSEFIAVCLSDGTNTFSVTAYVLSLLLHCTTLRSSCIG